MESANKRFLYTSYDAWKNRTTKHSERVSFFDASQQLNTIVQAFSMECFYFIHTDIYTVKYEANDCENTSFVQSEKRKIVLHSVNLNLSEINFLKRRHSLRQ